MANFHTAQKRSQNLKPKQIRIDFFKYIRSIEKLFFELNVKQLEDSKGSDNNLLEHKNSDLYTGVYSESTQGFADLDGISTKKTAGDPYNFLWSGDFFKGFELYIKNGDLELFSTGTGSGDKADFFQGYEYLFGLTDDNLKEVIDTKLLPFFIQIYRQRLT